MCTVSYIRTGNATILTANRDELISRPTALPPRAYQIGKKRVIYPQDPLSGGSWFCADEDGNCAVLLNGAEIKHQSAPPYRNSRGLILREIIGANSPLSCWDNIYLHNIEPFTIVLLQDNTLHKLSWNGAEKVRYLTDPDKPQIWSSATLYGDTIRKKREQWFSDFLRAKENLTGDDLLNFHRDRQNGLMISRGDALRTLSITQALFTDHKVQVYYLQLSPEETYRKSIPLR